MTKAISTTTTAAPATTPGLPPTSRRWLLAGSGLAAVLAAVSVSAASMPPTHPDTVLLDACAVATAAHDAMFAVPRGAPDDDHAAAQDRYHAAYDVVDGLHPTTLAGLKAKTRVMMAGFEMCVAHDIGSTVEDLAEWHEMGVWRLMHDALALGEMA